jgi:hypothetical protein
MYERAIPELNLKRKIQKLLIRVNYKNMNPDINSIEMEPKTDENYIHSIAKKNNINNIIFEKEQDSNSNSVEDYDIKIKINIFFYPTIQNVTVLFIFPAVSTTKFEFIIYDKYNNLIHSSKISRDNIYFFLCLPFSLFLYDGNADEKILNEYFRFISNRILLKENL